LGSSPLSSGLDGINQYALMPLLGMDNSHPNKGPQVHGAAGAEAKGTDSGAAETDSRWIYMYWGTPYQWMPVNGLRI
jgi:hypothetical protein